MQRSSAQGLSREIALQLVMARALGRPRPALGRYQIQRKLGSGGMGSVFLAFDPTLDREVAVKVLDEGPGEEGIERLVSEARILARLAHPHILSVHDMGEEAGQVWMVTEYARGGTLKEWLSAQSGLQWSRVAAAFLQIADGLDAAHRAGVLHRDVKPDNVFVSHIGHALVADFGLASSGSGPEGSTGRYGTPAYWAPETERGGRTDARGDQYSYFVSFAEMLGLCREEPPDELVELIARGRAPSPEERWPSMREVVERLQPLVAPPTSRFFIPQRWTPRADAVAPKSEPARLDRLVEIATESRSKLEFRTEALRWLDYAVGFDTALVGQVEHVGEKAPLLQGFSKAFVEQFQREASRYAPTLSRLVGESLANQRPIQDVDFYGFHERSKTPFYTEIIGPKGSKAMAIGALAVAGELVGTLQISRSSRGTRFRDYDLRRLRSALRVFALGEKLWLDNESARGLSLAVPGVDRRRGGVMARTVHELSRLGLRVAAVADVCALPVETVTRILERPVYNAESRVLSYVVDDA